jgi:AraC-like DNA-binding protein
LDRYWPAKRAIGSFVCGRCIHRGVFEEPFSVEQSCECAEHTYDHVLQRRSLLELLESSNHSDRQGDTETNISCLFKKVCMSRAAAIAALEPKYFGKFFRCKVGIGFKTWTTFVRVQTAVKAIQNTYQPLTDIAYSVGFRDLSTFERAFKKLTGSTPRQFRKDVLKALAKIA